MKEKTYYEVIGEMEKRLDEIETQLSLGKTCVEIIKRIEDKKDVFGARKMIMVNGKKYDLKFLSGKEGPKMEYVKYDPKQRVELKKNLERLRLRYNLSKQELADDLGWSRNTIDSWLRGDRVPDKTGIEAICDYFGIDDVELLGSEMKVRTFAYYKDDSLIAFGTMEEIAEQTGRKIESLRSLLCNSKRFNKTTKTYMIELEDDKRYKLKFKQSFTIDELNLKGIGWLLESPLVEVEEVEK